MEFFASINIKHFSQNVLTTLLNVRDRVTYERQLKRIVGSAIALELVATAIRCPLTCSPPPVRPLVFFEAR